MTILFHHPAALEHRTPHGHPERPERMREYLTAADLLDRLTMTAWKTDQEEGSSWAADIQSGHCNGLPLPNVWLGVSVEDQPRADQRIPVLLDTPAALRWISAEPLLGSTDLKNWLSPCNEFCTNGCTASGDEECARDLPLLDWVVVGGESGPGARPMHPQWARSLRDHSTAPASDNTPPINRAKAKRKRMAFMGTLLATRIRMQITCQTSQIAQVIDLNG